MAEKKGDNAKKSYAARKELGKLWMERLEESRKREELWRSDALDAEAMYAQADRALASSNAPETRARYNILHSNVETIVPAIFSNSPEPDIRSRWISGDQDDNTAKDVGRLLERAIKVQTDDNALDEQIEMMAQDAYVSGRGVLRIRFNADVEQEVSVDAPVNPDAEAGEASTVVVNEVPINERLEFESVSWRDFRMGPATRWEDVPWVAFRLMVPKETLQDVMDFDLKEYEDSIGGFDATMREEDREACKDSMCVWEIWCKTTKTVKFLREADGMVLRNEKDPLGLSGFFPMPPPMVPIRLNGKLEPICPYSVYRLLAEELDVISKRIKHVTTGIKVRGLIAGGTSNIIDVAEAEDNEIVVATDLEGLAQMGGLSNAVMWWPIEQHVAVLAQLYQSRELTKQAIHEITGIADIMRGESDARETLGAQKLKTQWGALRVQKMQRQVRRTVRDTFVVCAELIARHFTDNTLQMMTGIPVTPQMRQLLDMPVMSHYRVDVESDTTVQMDTSKVRGEMAEFLTGSGQYFATMAPIVAEAPEAATMLIEIYSSFARNFKLGKQAEDALEQFSEAARQAAQQAAQQEQQMSPEQQAMMAENQIKRDTLQLKLEEARGKMQLELQKLQLEVQKAAIEAQKSEFDARAKAEELGIKRDSVEIEAADVERKVIRDAEEIELEQEQQRPVAIG